MKLRKPISVGYALISKTQPVGFPLLDIGLRLKLEKI